MVKKKKTNHDANDAARLKQEVLDLVYHLLIQ
jgi:phosphoribosyl-ATP pyrophosphohydrolase